MVEETRLQLPSMLMISPVSARPLTELMYTSVVMASAREPPSQCQTTRLWADRRG